MSASPQDIAFGNLLLDIHTYATLTEATPRGRSDLLPILIPLVDACDFSDQQIERLIKVFAGLVKDEKLDPDASMAQLIVPLAYAIEGHVMVEEMVRLIAGYMEHTSRQGVVLAQTPYDLLLCNTVAMLLKRIEPLPVTTETADNLCYVLKRNPDNDRELIGLIEPYTSLGARRSLVRLASAAPDLRPH